MVEVGAVVDDGIGGQGGTAEPEDKGTDGGIVVEGTNVDVGLGAWENVVCGGGGCDVWLRTWVRSCWRFVFW